MARASRRRPGVHGLSSRVPRRARAARGDAGLTIIRGWHVVLPMACVWFQRWGGDREIQVLLDCPPVAAIDIAGLRQLVLTDSGTLSPGFRCEDHLAPQAFEPIAASV